MKSLLKKYFIIAISSTFTTLAIPAFTVTGSLQDILISYFLLTILIYFVRPVISIFFLPINLLTLNLFAWVINVGIIYIWSVISKGPNFSLWQFNGFSFGGITITSYNFVPWQTFIITAIFLIIIVSILEWMLK